MSKESKDQRSDKAKAKKLHIEIMPANWGRLNDYIEEYNEDPERVTPKIKYGHVINEALRLYFKKRKIR
jgi:hypothetical protein